MATAAGVTAVVTHPRAGRGSWLGRRRMASRAQPANGAPLPLAPRASANGAPPPPPSVAGKRKVLFVCLGNICRSPTAEAVFNARVAAAGVAADFLVDSCGTGGGNPSWYVPGGFSYHEGEPADARMTATAARRGVTLTSRSRPLTPEDLDKFDLLVGMDPKNLRAIDTAAKAWNKEPPTTVLMSDFCADAGVTSVPDPYYGGERGFEVVLDLLDEACGTLLDAMRAER